MSNKISSGEQNYKYFIGYLHDDYKFKPLGIIFPKTKAYVKSYDDQTKWMYFLIKDDDLLEKYNTICNKVSTDTKKGFDSKPVCNKKCLKTKIKSSNDETTYFHNKEMPKARSNYICLAVTKVDSTLKKDENYYPQGFLKEYQYIEKEVIRHITEDIWIFSSDSDEE